MGALTIVSYKCTFNKHTRMSAGGALFCLVINFLLQNLQNQLQLLQKPKVEETLNPGNKEKNVASSSKSDCGRHGKTD